MVGNMLTNEVKNWLWLTKFDFFFSSNSSVFISTDRLIAVASRALSRSCCTNTLSQKQPVTIVLSCYYIKISKVVVYAKKYKTQIKNRLLIPKAFLLARIIAVILIILHASEWLTRIVIDGHHNCIDDALLILHFLIVRFRSEVDCFGVAFEVIRHWKKEKIWKNWQFV